ncbi:uncharacterized protein N7484_000021 [Penicillium longicatenatum]|uniref:uncharacterized protein n=1 Tax=Penicillium longicatenatum TaxID=1561947 RepID=UPI0025483010|nr:uncharacterized protein N7484_000021 [Penicillium longicatenatum]KAJ5660649.1 hypothetical protein N7484_000021 [Penicillium longicatenatum]
MTSSRLRPPLAAAAVQPTKATQPTGPPSPPLPALPPKGSPCGTTVQPAGCLAWAIPPGRGPRPPSRGQAECTMGPETPPCRRRAPAETLRACQPAAVPTAPLPPVRERRAPCPPSLASLHTLRPHFECEICESGVKVYKKLSKTALHYGVGPSFWTAQFSADLVDKKAEFATPSPGPTGGSSGGAIPPPSSRRPPQPGSSQPTGESPPRSLLAASAALSGQDQSVVDWRA